MVRCVTSPNTAEPGAFIALAIGFGGRAGWRNARLHEESRRQLAHNNALHCDSPSLVQLKSRACPDNR